MKNAERTVQLIVKVSAEERNEIYARMLQVGTKNFSRYARKMLLDGYIIQHDFDEIRKLTHELGSLSRSINQIALRVNETRNIYEEDILDLQRMYSEVKAKVSERLVKIMND